MKYKGRVVTLDANYDLILVVATLSHLLRSYYGHTKRNHGFKNSFLIYIAK